MIHMIGFVYSRYSRVIFRIIGAVFLSFCSRAEGYDVIFIPSAVKPYAMFIHQEFYKVVVLKFYGIFDYGFAELVHVEERFVCSVDILLPFFFVFRLCYVVV